MDLIKELENACAKYPNNMALYSSGKGITYRQIRLEMDTWQDRIGRLGIPNGARVVVCVSNLIPFIGICSAIWRGKGIVIPVAPESATVELPRVISESKCDYAILSGILDADLSQVGRAEALTDDIHGYSFEREAVEGNANCALFLSTSGTTGRPKCVWFTGESFSKNIIYLKEKMGLIHDDICFTPISLFLPSAMNTILWPALISGATVILEPCFLPTKVDRILREGKVTVFYSVPYFYDKYVQSGMEDKLEAWKGVRLCLVSSALLSKQLFDTFQRQTSMLLHSIYCASETGVIAYNASPELCVLRQSVGSPMPEVEVRVINENGGTVGEIQVNSRLAAGGYFTPQDGFTSIGPWISTGDRGQWMDSYTLQVLGRMDDILNIGGFLVSPNEVEAVVTEHPDVLECYVFGERQLDETYISADVVIKNPVSCDDILDFCMKKLPRYKIPRSIQFVDKLKRGRYGKIYRGTTRMDKT